MTVIDDPTGTQLWGRVKMINSPVWVLHSQSSRNRNLREQAKADHVSMRGSDKLTLHTLLDAPDERPYPEQFACLHGKKFGPVHHPRNNREWNRDGSADMAHNLDMVCLWQCRLMYPHAPGLQQFQLLEQLGLPIEISSSDFTPQCSIAGQTCLTVPERGPNPAFSSRS